MGAPAPQQPPCLLPCRPQSLSCEYQGLGWGLGLREHGIPSGQGSGQGSGQRAPRNTAHFPGLFPALLHISFLTPPPPPTLFIFKKI